MATQKMTLEQKKLSILVAVGLFFMIAVSLILTGNSFVRYRNDFFGVWYATTKLFEEDRSLYDELNGQEVVEYSHFPDPRKAGFYYPAHLLLITGPLALLPYPAALFVWLLVIQIFYVVGIWLVSDLNGWPETIGQKSWFLVAAILFIPYLQQTFWGQFNTIAVVSLALTFLALSAGRMGLAGALAAGMTFKPQASGLVLIFLVVWALFRRERWQFLLGLTLTGALLWLVAEALQPGWVGAFLDSLNLYVPTRSVIDRFWNPNQLISGILLIGSLLVFYRNRHCTPDSPGFAACLAFSFAIGALIVPVVGMMHMVLFPIILIFLLRALKSERLTMFKPALLIFGFIYIAGWFGFILGLLFQGQSGGHIDWAELAYKVLVPLLIIVFALPITLGDISERWKPAHD